MPSRSRPGRPPPFVAFDGPLAAAAALAALATAGPVLAAGFSVTASAYADDAQGTSYDLSAVLRPTPSWWLGAGLGASDTNLPSYDFSGRTWRASAGWQGDRLGLRLGTRQWQDSADLDSRSSDLEASYGFASGFTVTAILQDRALEVGYTVTGLAGRILPFTADFSGRGYGTDLSWGNEAWFLSIRGVAVDYGEELERVRRAAAAPLVGTLPRVASLVDSMLTNSFATTDRELGATVDRGFGRAGLRLDLTRSRDALTGASTGGASLSYRYALSPLFEVEGTVGASDGDGYDTSMFGGLSLTVRN
jgi:hypothetical protein